MALSSAISNGLTNSFSKTVTTFDLRDSDFRICQGHVHICSKELNFRAWSALLMVHLVTASLSAENLLTQPTVLASLFSDCSPHWPTAVWKLYLACHQTEKMLSLPLCSESLFLILCTYLLPYLAWFCLLVEKLKGKKNSHATHSSIKTDLLCCSMKVTLLLHKIQVYHLQLWRYTHLTITNSQLVNHIFFWRLHQIFFDGSIFVTVNPGFYFLNVSLSRTFLSKKSFD